MGPDELRPLDVRGPADGARGADRAGFPAGAPVVLAFAVEQGGGSLSTADLYLFGALLVCAAGYTEGGRLAREMPGWQVVGWALVGCLPLALAGAVLALAREPVRLGVHGMA